jgi:PAS domain S-box-containing protein
MRFVKVATGVTNTFTVPPVFVKTARMDTPRESSLKRLQAGYRQLFERYPLPMLVVDLATLRLLAANEAAARCYGYTIRQLTDMHLPDIYFEEDHRALPAYMALAPQERARQRQWRHRGHGGRAIKVEIDAEDMELHGLPTRMLLVNDISHPEPAPSTHPVASDRSPSSVHSLEDAFFMLDHSARFTAVNAQAEQLLQVRRDQLLGRTLWERCPQAFGAAYRAQYEVVAQQGQAICFEFYFELRQIWLEVRAFPCSDGVAAYFRDVSTHHENNQRLEQERERLKAIVNASSEAIITVDTAGCVQTFNPGAEHLFGWTQEQVVGRCLNLLLPERFRSQHMQFVSQFASSDASSRMVGQNRIKGLCSDGREMDMEGSISQVTVGQNKLLIATLRDVTGRNLADAERQAARVQLSDLARRLMSQEKDLVKRMAQALHDQLGQTTAAIRILHDTMGVLRRGKESREYLRLDLQLGKLIDQVTRQVRMVLVDLHPPLLDEQGLAAALDNELRGRALSQKAMNFVLNMPPAVLELRWPAAVEYGAFMVAREAIENALRHAFATVVTVTLGGHEQQMALDIADNGHGMAPAAASKAGHLGITGMLERARSIGATVTVDPVPTGGTCVCLRWNSTP